MGSHTEKRTEKFYVVSEAKRTTSRRILVPDEETYIIHVFKSECFSLFWIVLYFNVFVISGCSS